MDVVSALTFLGAAVVLTVMPGPDNLFVLAQSIAKGKQAGISTTLGLCTGLFVHMTAAAIGLSAAVYQSALAFNIVKYAGAAYLLYLAYRSFREKAASIMLPDGNDSLDRKSLYKKGIVMNVLNPKVSLFFLAFLPQFVHGENGRGATLQILAYGIAFLVQALIIFTCISIFAGKIGGFLRQNPALAKRMNIIQGILFALIGFNIAFSQK